MKQLSIMMKPASSLCNMRCKYCFYEDVSDLRDVKSYGRMSRDTAKIIIEKSLAYADDVTFAFQGGEPTLAGLPFFQFFTDTVDKVLKETGKPVQLHYALQTNGTMIDEDWCRFLKQHQFLVGLSMDGNAAFHDENRLDAQRKGTFSRVHQTKKLLEQFGIEFNILTVLTNRMARFPQKVWKWICEDHIQYIQFVPCLGPLEAPETPYSLTPERFCQFYTVLFELWAQDFRKGRYRSVKFFDDLFNLLVRHQVTACGFTGRCTMQFIVEGDGSVYPCDFYVLDQWKCGSFLENSIEEMAAHPNASGFVERDHEIHEKCASCRWWNLCGGGCRRMRDNMYIRKGKNTCGYGSFLDQNAQKIEQIIRLL